MKQRPERSVLSFFFVNDASERPVVGLSTGRNDRSGGAHGRRDARRRRRRRRRRQQKRHRAPAARQFHGRARRTARGFGVSRKSVVVNIKVFFQTKIDSISHSMLLDLTRYISLVSIGLWPRFHLLRSRFKIGWMSIPLKSNNTDFYYSFTIFYFIHDILIDEVFTDSILITE